MPPGICRSIATSPSYARGLSTLGSRPRTLPRGATAGGAALHPFALPPTTSGVRGCAAPATLLVNAGRGGSSCEYKTSGKSNPVCPPPSATLHGEVAVVGVQVKDCSRVPLVLCVEETPLTLILE